MKRNKKCETTHKKGVMLLELWKKLKKYGIHNEKELDEAIKKINLLNISCFIYKAELIANENS